MIAFAANSLLNRLALIDGAIGPAGFAFIRVGTGVIVLCLLLALRDRQLPRFSRPNFIAVVGLSTYMLGFSFAYVSMDAGLGALVLFGGVQITMFIGALMEGDNPPPRRWLGMIFAMGGLAILTYPSGPMVITTTALLLMCSAAIGWGTYSLIGRRAKDPLYETGWNFFYSLPIMGFVFIGWPDTISASMGGIILAMISGGITSALGYALWYWLLPILGATKGALAQLSAPAIALVLGAIIINEPITLSALLATVLILGGIAVGLLPISRSKS